MRPFGRFAGYAALDLSARHHATEKVHQRYVGPGGLDDITRLGRQFGHDAPLELLIGAPVGIGAVVGAGQIQLVQVAEPPLAIVTDANAVIHVGIVSSNKGRHVEEKAIDVVTLDTFLQDLQAVVLRPPAIGAGLVSSGIFARSAVSVAHEPVGMRVKGRLRRLGQVKAPDIGQALRMCGGDHFPGKVALHERIAIMERQLGRIEGDDPAYIGHDDVRAERAGFAGDRPGIFQRVDFAQVCLEDAIFMLPPFVPVKAVGGGC